MAGITLRNIYKRYPDGSSAANNISVEIPDGEFVVLTGPAGCGKSTLLRIIAGLEPTTYGEISMDGRYINDVPARERGMAMLMRDIALYPHLNVAENIAFALRLRKTPKDEAARRVGEAAELLGLTDVLDRMPAALTGVQRQKAAIGRAVVRKPKVYIFDEMFDRLDTKLRETMRAELKNLHRQLGATFIYASSNPLESIPMGGRAIILKDGYLQQTGSTQEVKSHPANLFVANFISDGGINTVEAELSEKGGRLVLNAASGLGTELPEELCENEKLRKLVGKKLLLGVYPRDVKVTADGAGAAAEVESVELIGTWLNLKLTAEGFRLDASIPAGCADIRAGDTVRAGFDAERLLFFDPDTEKALRL